MFGTGKVNFCQCLQTFWCVFAEYQNFRNGFPAVIRESLWEPRTFIDVRDLNQTVRIRDKKTDDRHVKFQVGQMFEHFAFQEPPNVQTFDNIWLKQRSIEEVSLQCEFDSMLKIEKKTI